MEVQEFRTLVSQEFGSRLGHATPGNVREFLDRMHGDVLGPRLTGRIVLEEQASTYEDVIKDFFARMLELPAEEAVVLLWLLAFDFAFSAIELQHAEKFDTLFGE